MVRIGSSSKSSPSSSRRCLHGVCGSELRIRIILITAAFLAGVQLTVWKPNLESQLDLFSIEPESVSEEQPDLVVSPRRSSSTSSSLSTTASLVSSEVARARHSSKQRSSDVSSKQLPSSIATLSEEEQQNAKNSKKKPTLTFHVGLPKTATTFLQCSLCTNLTLTQSILEQDNLVYVGTCPFKDCRLREIPENQIWHRHSGFFEKGVTWPKDSIQFGPMLHGDETETTRWQDLPKLNATMLRLVQKAAEGGHDALIIFEGASRFSSEHIASLKQAFSESFDDIHIVAAYRRLYDWLPSRYNSEVKGRMYAPWPGQTEDKLGKKKRTGNKVEAFDIDNVWQCSDYVHTLEHENTMHPTEMVARNYQRHFDQVSMIDMHYEWPETIQGDSYLSDFLCHYVPNAPHACQAAKDDQFGEVSENPSISLEFDIVAQAAWQAGLVSNSSALSRYKVTRKVRSFFNNNDDDNYELPWPKICLSQDKLDRLLRLSLDTERHAFGDAFTSEQEAKHREGFERAVAKQKYCSVDADKVLADPTWQDFFANLDA